MAKMKYEEKPKTLDYAKMRARDMQPVRGVFHYHEQKGGTLEFGFKKYKEDKITEYKLVDGKIYTLPRCVAEHLNQNCSYPVHNHYKTEDNKYEARVSDMIHRTGFSGLDFTELGDMQNGGLNDKNIVPSLSM